MAFAGFAVTVDLLAALVLALLLTGALAARAASSRPFCIRYS
ncbi:Uncharacterised protein [Streptococcus pneumoniae]|nr:Uncharacterised protein [Streptococcus pneumoniae]